MMWVSDLISKLADAASKNNFNKVKNILNGQNVTSNVLEYIARTVAEKGNLKVFEYVVEKEPSVLQTSYKISDPPDWDYSTTIVHIAASQGNLDIIRYAIQKEPSLFEKVDRRKRTIAHAAAENGHVNILWYIAKENPSILVIKDEKGDTPCHIAVGKNCMTLLRFLTEKKIVT